MSDIARMIDAVIREGLAPALKEDGYKKTGRNFYKVSKEAIRLVNVQASQWNQGKSGKLTVNLAVHLPSIAKLNDRQSRGKLPKQYECTCNERLGVLMPKGQDYWWTVRKTTAHSVARHLADSWQEYGKPWLDAPWEDFRVARKLLSKHHRVMEAIAASVLLGDLEWAERRLRKIIKGTIDSGQDAQWLIKRAQKLGIAV